MRFSGAGVVPARVAWAPGLGSMDITPTTSGSAWHPKLVCTLILRTHLTPACCAPHRQKGAGSVPGGQHCPQPQVGVSQVAAKLQETEQALREQDVVLKAVTLERDKAMEELRAHGLLPRQEPQVSASVPQPPLLAQLSSCSRHNAHVHGGWLGLLNPVPLDDWLHTHR